MGSAFAGLPTDVIRDRPYSEAVPVLHSVVPGQ